MSSEPDHDWEDVWTRIDDKSRRLDKAVCRNCGSTCEPKFYHIRETGGTRSVYQADKTCLQATVESVYDS